MNDPELQPPDDYLSSLGVNIRRLRLKNHLTQESLAVLAGVSVSTLKRILSGQSPNLDTACRIADALHVSLDELTGRTLPSPAEERQSEDKPLVAYKLLLQEKDAQLAWQHNMILAQRIHIRRYQRFLLACVAIFIALLLVDLFCGSVGFVRYAISR